MTRYLVIGGVVVASLASLTVYLSSASVARAADSCDVTYEDVNQKIECWMDIVREELLSGGMESAMDAFSLIYDQHPIFANTGCHRHAHRVGDMVYYEHYLGVGNLDELEFPPSSTACGYGFYHGFLEHLIQDNPDAEFISRTCTYFERRLSAIMGDIRSTCYHGSGHGLTLARAEMLPREAWGSLEAFVDQPLSICAALPEATAREISECQEGVFNVVVDWMEIEEFGFRYDRADPFALCDTQSGARLRACYYEMAMKLDSVADYDPQKLARVVDPIEDDELRILAFQVGIAGLVQHVAASGAYGTIFDSCASLEDEYASACVTSIVNGLFEHGRPREEYRAASAFCRAEGVTERGLVEDCWRAFGARLKRFYDPQMSGEICTRLEAPHGAFCTAQLGT